MENNTIMKLMEKNNMTAVDWLKKNLETYGDPEVCTISWGDLDNLLKNAKQKEEQQIRAAWTDGHCLGSNGLVVVDYSNGQEYYNKNFKK